MKNIKANNSERKQIVVETCTSNYYLIETKDGQHFKIFFVNQYGQKRFITHRYNLKQALKVTRILSHEYNSGYMSI